MLNNCRKVCSPAILYLLIALNGLLVGATVYDPVKELVSLNREVDFRARRFLASGNSNVIVTGIRCKLEKPENKTLRLNWSLNFVPCGVRIDSLSIEQYAKPCRNNSLTEFIASDTTVLQCNGVWNSFSSLISEQLTPPTGFPNCNNATISAHRHSNSTGGIVATTWQSGSYVFYIGAGLVDESDGENWQLQLQLHVRTSKGGYLPAPVQPLLPFWGATMGAYCLIVMTWVIICGKDWRGVVRLHSFITLAIFTGFIEAAFSLTVAYGVNRTGQPRMEWNIAAEIAQAVKGTTLRMLLIVIAMGYGSTKANRFHRSIFPYLGVFGAIYFVSVAVPAIMGVIKPFYVKMVIYSKIPSILVNVISVTWIIVSLFKTARILKHHGDTKKLSVYNALVAVMAVSFAASVVFIAVRIYIGLNSPCPQWQLWWLDEAFWSIIALIIMISICILWRPSQTTLVWAYSSLQNEEDETYSRTAAERITADSRL